MTLAEEESMLLDSVPLVTAIGNVSLRAALQRSGWTEEQYWAVRNRLIEKGVLEPGRGKGGSVRRVVTQTDEPATDPIVSPPASTEAIAYAAEKDLYVPMAAVIRSRWAQDYRLDEHLVEITAQQGARQTGGKWTRPDITVASLKTFAYVPGRHFDLITFEIKPFETLDVTIVYEALAHRRSATRAYALAHVPENKLQESMPLIEDIALEAKRHGVGFIVASDPSNYDTWEEFAEATRHDPDPERMNDFLAQQVTQSFREQIVRWFRY